MCVRPDLFYVTERRFRHSPVHSGPDRQRHPKNADFGGSSPSRFDDAVLGCSTASNTIGYRNAVYEDCPFSAARFPVGSLLPGCILVPPRPWLAHCLRPLCW